VRNPNNGSPTPVIAFHGTNHEAAAKIRVEGFRIGTYFAFKREDALFFGGHCLFTVKFDPDPSKWHGGEGDENWQFHIREHVPPDKIIDFNDTSEHKGLEL